MKIDICTRTETYREVCKDVKFCCSTLEGMYKQHFIEFNNNRNSYKATCFINLRDYNRDYQLYGNMERIPMINCMPIDYCPFCGEKIET